MGSTCIETDSIVDVLGVLVQQQSVATPSAAVLKYLQKAAQVSCVAVGFG